AAVDALERAGKPVVRIRVASKHDIGEEFFRWEVATAIAGAIMGINPFNQPDVEASKLATRALTSEYEKTGKLPSESPFFEGEGGPNSGVFLQVTCDDARDLPVPGSKYTFGIVKAAQARGDFQVLSERGRRALRVHLGSDVAAGLRTLASAIEKALA